MKIKHVSVMQTVTQSDIVAAANGIQGAVATYTILTSISPTIRAVGMWIVQNDETKSGQGSLYKNDGISYSYITVYPYGADDLVVDTSSFSGILSIADTTVQKALDTIDNITKTSIGLGSVDNVQQMPLSYLDTDGTLAANSNSKVASQAATKTYADTKIAKTTNVTSINETGIADNKLAIFNNTSKDIRPGTIIDNAGALSAITTINMNNQLTNTLAIGTAPMVITSTTKVNNLNVDKVDGADLSIDGTFASNSDVLFPSEKASKTYADTIKAIFTSMKEPTGINYVTAPVYTINSGTQIFTVTGTFEVWYRGTKFTKTSVTETTTIANTSGLHYIYYDSSGVLQNSMTEWDIKTADAVPVAEVYFNKNAPAIAYIQWESHGITMDSDTHYNIHRSRGTSYISGFSLSGYTVAPAAPADADNQVGITAGVIADEDIKVSVTHAASPSAPFSQILNEPCQIPTWYLNDEGADGVRWRKGTASAVLFNYTAAGYINYNNPTLGTQVQCGNNNYVVSYILGSSNYHNGVILNEPVLILQGQRVDATLADARSNNTLSSLLTYGIAFVEYKLLYIIFWKTGAAYTSTGKCRIEAIDDYRFDRIGGAAATQAANHSALTNLSYNTAGHTDFQRLTHISNTDPTVNNDDIDSAALGKAFLAGNLWYNTTGNKLYIAKSVSTGAAVWSQEVLTADLASYVPITRTINGYPLSSDIVLSAYDVGLGNVANLDLSGESIPFGLDGGGFTLKTGVQYDLVVPWNCNLTAAYIINQDRTDATDAIQIDLYRCTFAQYDSGAAHPVSGDSILTTGSKQIKITAGATNYTGSVTGISVSLTVGDILRIYVDSVVNVKTAYVRLAVTRT